MTFQKGHKINIGNDWNKGKIPWNKGRKHTEETKQKMKDNHSKWWLGKHHSEESKEKMRKPKFFSAEAIKKIKESLKNNKHGRGNKGRPHTEEEKLNISKFLIGKKNHWKGGITPLYYQVRNHFKSRQWRDDVFTRDNFTCQECGQIGGNLNAHHIKSFSSIIQFYEITVLKEALECEELWNINNGITLCENCHRQTFKYRNQGSIQNGIS